MEGMGAPRPYWDRSEVRVSRPRKMVPLPPLPTDSDTQRKWLLLPHGAGEVGLRPGHPGNCCFSQMTIPPHPALQGPLPPPPAPRP